MTELSVDQIKQLVAPLNPNRVASRKQGGATLSYLQAWDVRATLIRVFGFGGWSAEVTGVKILRMEQDVPALEYNKDRNAPKKQKIDPLTGEAMFNWSVTALAEVKLTIHQLGAVYSEAAVASQVGPDVGEVSDFAVKTAESDALKRAAVNLGTQYGLSLYDSGNTADVVRVILEPVQKKLLAEARGQNPNVQKDAPRVAPAEVDPQLDIEEDTVDPAAQARAQDAVRGAFGG
jgi:recombination DNA repair RAD52 pathway protein